MRNLQLTFAGIINIFVQLVKKIDWHLSHIIKKYIVSINYRFIREARYQRVNIFFSTYNYSLLITLDTFVKGSESSSLRSNPLLCAVHTFFFIFSLSKCIALKIIFISVINVELLCLSTAEGWNAWNGRRMLNEKKKTVRR
jgi:hypothetical protein